MGLKNQHKATWCGGKKTFIPDAFGFPGHQPGKGTIRSSVSFLRALVRLNNFGSVKSLADINFGLDFISYLAN